MKICDLTQFYSPVSGGVRRYIEQKALYVRNHCPGSRHVLIVPGETTGRSGDETCRVYTIASPLVSRTSRYRVLLKLHLVEEVLERENPDIIESGDPYQLAWKAVASGRGLDIPIVGFYHSHFPEALMRSVSKVSSRAVIAMWQDVCRRYVKALYNSFEQTFVPSPILADLLRSWGVEKISNIDLGVDTEIFHPADESTWAMRQELGIPTGRKVLLYVGRLAPEKNVGTLFEAFDLLHQRSPGEYQLLAVGDGTWRKSLLKLKDKTQSVSWLPFCQDPYHLASIYRTADLFVHPGIQETFGLVTLESQACGTPVVGIRGSYMDRIIFSNQAQWASENSPLSLADAIEAKFHEDLRKSGLIASQTARHQYSWKTVFSRLFSIYDDVIAGYKA